MCNLVHNISISLCFQIYNFSLLALSISLQIECKVDDFCKKPKSRVFSTHFYRKVPCRNALKPMSLERAFFELSRKVDLIFQHGHTVPKKEGERLEMLLWQRAIFQHAVFFIFQIVCNVYFYCYC